MGVIPLISAGDHPTVVNTPEDFKRAGGLDGNSVLIINLDPTQLAVGDEANITYDLRVGPMYRDHRSAAPVSLEDNDSIKLAPGAAVIIQTEEWVHFPSTMFGHVVSKVSLLQRGVSNTSSKVDPGYNGPLIITVFNLGQQTVPLQRRERFCALYVISVEGRARLYSRPGKSLEGQRIRRGAWGNFAEWLKRHDAIVKTVLALLTVALGSIQVARSLGWFGAP